MLELAFATKKLRSESEDAALAEAAFGPVVASALIARLADLRAASHPLDLPFASKISGTDRIRIVLVDGKALLIAANHPAPPRAGDGEVAWEHVHRIIILGVE